MTINTTPATEALKEQVVTRWTNDAKKQVELVNLFTVEDPKYLKINVDAPNNII